jgi:hypothetical protein
MATNQEDENEQKFNSFLTTYTNTKATTCVSRNEINAIKNIFNRPEIVKQKKPEQHYTRLASYSYIILYNIYIVYY